MGQKQELKDKKPESSVEHEIKSLHDNNFSLIARWKHSSDQSPGDGRAA
jgi:hypothetical protein